MSDRSLPTASSAATTVGCAASPARSSCRQAYTPAGGDRGCVVEIRRQASCCRAYVCAAETVGGGSAVALVYLDQMRQRLSYDGTHFIKQAYVGYRQRVIDHAI